MKILKYGEGYPKTVTCKNCNSELEYEPEDILGHTDIYTDRTETFKYIKCPVCGQEITVDVMFRELLSPKKKGWW